MSEDTDDTEDTNEISEWLNHPNTRKMAKGYVDRYHEQTLKICYAARGSTDTKMVAMAAVLDMLKVEVKVHGGKL